MGKGCIKGRLGGDDRTRWDKRSHWQELLPTRKMQNTTKQEKQQPIYTSHALELVPVIVSKWPHLQTQHKQAHKGSIRQQPRCDFWIVSLKEVSQSWRITPLWATCNLVEEVSEVICYYFLMFREQHLQVEDLDMPNIAKINEHKEVQQTYTAVGMSTFHCLNKKVLQECFPSSVEHWGTALSVHC